MSARWQPVRNGDYDGQVKDHTISVDGEWLTISEPDLTDGSINEATLAVHDDLRLCRQVEVADSAGVLVSAEMLESLRYAFNTAYFDISATPHVDRIRAWLDTQASAKEGGRDG